MTKEIPGLRKVDNLCVKVDRGECFCLLGVAGAGKTATLKMLVGARMPTSGDVLIDGISLMKNYPKVIMSVTLVSNFIVTCSKCKSLCYSSLLILDTAHMSLLFFHN